MYEQADDDDGKIGKMTNGCDENKLRNSICIPQMGVFLLFILKDLNAMNALSFFQFSHLAEWEACIADVLLFGRQMNIDWLAGNVRVGWALQAVIAQIRRQLAQTRQLRAFH